MRRVLPLTAWAAIGVLGCGPGGGSRVEIGKLPPPEAKTPFRSVQTGDVEIVARAPDRSRSWVVRAGRSELTYVGEGTVTGRLWKIRGELFQDDRLASRFTADEGTVDQAHELLEMRGNVRIREVNEGTLLEAERVAWLPERKLVEAAGSVWIRHRAYEAGPAERLWAKPDLTEAGTPDTFAE